MATVQTTDKENQQTQPGSPDAGMAQAGNPQAGGTQPGAGSAIAGSGGQANSTGTGSGGQGMWTNIQSYIQANQGNNQTADALKTQAGNQFGQEKQQAQDQSNQWTQSAQKGVDDSKISQDTASQAIGNASKSYNYSGTQSQDYNNAVNPISSYLTSSYNAPQAFNYQTSAQTQNTGQALNNDQQFGQYMGGVYNQMAGQPITSGQMNLQNQIDSSNPNVQATRQQLLGQYSQLGSDIGNTVSQTNAQVPGFQQQYQQNQSDLKNYLTQQATGDRTNFDNQYSAAKTAQTVPFQQQVDQDSRFSAWAHNDLNADEAKQATDYANAHGGLGNYNNQLGQAEWELNQGGKSPYLRQDWANSQLSAAQQNLANGKNQSLNQNIDDSDKRQWNTIEQMLGTGNKLDELQS